MRTGEDITATLKANTLCPTMTYVNFETQFECFIHT